MRTKGNGLVQRIPPPTIVLVANGEHLARLVDVFPFSNAHGERLGFAYEIQAGPDAGAILLQSAACSASPTSKLAMIVRDLLGREPTEDELAQGIGRELVGVSCRITAREEHNRAGTKYSAVHSVTR